MVVFCGLEVGVRRSTSNPSDEYDVGFVLGVGFPSAVDDEEGLCDVDGFEGLCNGSFALPCGRKVFIAENEPLSRFLLRDACPCKVVR